MIGSSGNDVYFSAAQMEPEMHPLIEAGASLTPYALIGGASYYAMRTPLREGATQTIFDYAAAFIREKASRTPLGLANTFRLPELMSFFTSPVYKGMQVGRSAIDPTRQVGRHIFGPEYFQTKDQLLNLKTVIGEQAFQDIEMKLLGNDFQILLEQGLDERSTASLIFQETQLEGVLEDGTEIIRGVNNVTSSKLLTSTAIAFENTSYQPEVLETLAREQVETRTQPIGRAVMSNYDVGLNPDNIFTVKGVGGAFDQVSPIGFATSPLSDSYTGFQGLKNKMAVPLSYLTFGMSRFNKVVKATFEQLPVIGDIAEKGLQTLGLSPYSGPQPFYKQFFSLGLKASAIGAAYMGVRTIDHYRRNFGLAGHLVASTAISGLAASLVSKNLKQAEGNLSRTLPAKVGLGLFALQMMPGFRQGVKEGVATTLVNADIARSYVGKYTGLSGYRRTLEGLFPGFTDPTVGAGVGIALAGLSYGKFGNYLIRNNKTILPEAIRNRIGFYKPRGGGITLPLDEGEALNRKIYEMFSPRLSMDKTSQRQGLFEVFNQFEEILTSDSYREVFEQYTKGKSFGEMSVPERNRLRDFLQRNSGMFAETYGLSQPEAKILSRKLFLTAKTEARVDFYESYMESNPLNKALGERLTEIGERYQNSNFVGRVFERIEKFGAKAYHAFFGASLGGPEYEEMTQELGEKTYLRRAGVLFAAGFLGHQLLTTGLFGSMEDPSDLKDTYEGKKLVEVKKGRFWEGGGTPYSGVETNYFRPHAYHLMMTQANERSVWGDEHDIYNPITKFFLKNFTYHLEEKNYYERPYPITSPALEGLPIIGPLLGSTIGSLLKPVKLMHEDEYMQVNAQGETEFAYREEYGSPASLGGLPPGKPIAPNNLMYRLGQIQYQQRELEGITGYAKNVMQKMFTGRETLGTQLPVMEASGRMDSSILNYWDMEVGGALFLSEPIRRLFPRPKSEIERYNPIMNSMPSWLPDRFKRGDPYRAIPSGFARLPGKGYESLYPELQGTPAEEYPLIHKYKILADVAPKSHKTLQMQQMLLERRAAGATTRYEDEFMDQLFETHRKRLAGLDDYSFHENAIKIPGLSTLTSETYKLGEAAIRRTAAPIEYLIPAGFRPVQKLLGDTKDIVQTYEYNELYGTPHAFWDAPMRDWLRPSMYSAMHMLGWEGKPLHVQRKEEVNEHFDKLQFIKFSTLAKQATNPKDKERYLRIASRTRVGVNPQGDAMSIYMSLPDSEKKYFDAFASADKTQRDRILEMMPEDQAHLYQSIWNRIDTGNQQSLYYGSQVEMNEDEIFKKSMELQQDMDLPPPDWVGWHKDVDMEDIKLKYITSIGEDIHNYNKFDSQVRRVNRMSYLGEAENYVYMHGMPNSRHALERLRDHGGINTFGLSVYDQNDGQPSYANIQYNYDRSGEISSSILETLRNVNY